MPPDIQPLTADDWPALEDLFGRAGGSSGCWCVYWRLGPTYRVRPAADNKRDLRKLAASSVARRQDDRPIMRKSLPALPD